MEFIELLGAVNNLYDYISATQEIEKCVNVPLTMSVILTLKKIRSLEIEFFNKCEGNGAAFLVFERLLKQPPSKTWRLLGKELILMVQYWLEAVRKHLLIHNQHWWMFLASLLSFIMDIKSKDPSLPNTVVELTTECLLDLSCNGQLNEIQREQVLLCVNQCSAESSRDLRVQMVGRLSTYFVKLATILSTCGHLPAQMGILETLLRWLIKRHDSNTRVTMASAWFPSQLFSKDTVDLFLNRIWREFYRDARDFLNIHNRNARRVVSVACSAFSVGDVVLFDGHFPDKINWLDVNSATKSITAYLDLRTVNGDTNGSRLDMLTITEDNIRSTQIRRKSKETLLLVETLAPPRFLLSELEFQAHQCLLRALVSPGDVSILDAALASVFPGMHQPCTGVVESRAKRIGIAVRSRNLKSPSTDSTTSLAQLHDKLNSLPPLKYDKVAQKVSITPDLPVVKEVDERDDFTGPFFKPKAVGIHKSNIKSDSKTKPKPLKRRFGVCLSENEDTTTLAKKHFDACQSETEDKYSATERRLGACFSDSEAKTVGKRTRCISPVNKDISASLLLVATLETSDDSVINDTFDKLYRDNPEYDLLDLLVKEALQNGEEKDSGITSHKKTQESDVIENTPVEKYVSHKQLSTTSRAKSTIVSNSTTDESNVDVIDDTPCYVYDRRKTVQANSKKSNNIIYESNETFDAAIVDSFFCQHMTEDNAGSIAISPTLAKKINETSSEESYDHADNLYTIKECKSDLYIKEDIIACLNAIIDKVCSDFEKYTDLMHEKHQQQNALNIVQCEVTSSNVTSSITKHNKALVSSQVPDNTKKVTLKYNLSKKRDPKMNTRQKKIKNSKDTNKVENENVLIENANTSSPVNTTVAMSTRKKRKLYSPKDDNNDNEEISRTKVDSRPLNVNNTPIAACYKELEKARRNRIRLPRKSRANSEVITSPKTRKLNDLFDKIRSDVVNDAKVTLVYKSNKKKDLSLYNLSSESEDQDFKEKKIKVQRRVSSSSLESLATKRGRLVKLVDYSRFDFCSSSEEEGKRPKKSKIAKRSKPRSRKAKKGAEISLIDERMREARPEGLETSFVNETTNEYKLEEHEPELRHVPAMEIIPDNINDLTGDIRQDNKTQISNKPDIIRIKQEKGVNKKKETITKSLLPNDVTEIIMPENKTKTSNQLDLAKIKKEECLTKKKENISKSLVASKKAKILKKGENNKNESKEKSNTSSVSPLPGLVVETEQIRNDDLTSSMEANLLQKFKKIYTEVPDPSQMDGTQNLLNEDNYVNLDENNPTEHVPIVLDKSAEMSIATGGRSPITGHNNFDEAPPNVDLLHEKFQHRDLNTEEMSPDMVEFLMKMRNQLNCIKTPTAPANNNSPVLPFTRASTKESIKRQSTTSVNSSVSNPKTVLKRLSSEDIEENINPIATSSQTSKNSSPKIVLTRISSEEIAKHTSSHANKSSSAGSITVVLERISSDEINKWLPIPQPKPKEAADEIPKKYNTRQNKKTTGVTKTTPAKLTKNKIKSIISPVKLNFDFPDSTKDCVQKTCNTRSSTRSFRSRGTVDKNKTEATEVIKSSNTDARDENKKKNDAKSIDEYKIQSTDNMTVVSKKDNEIATAVESGDKVEYTPEHSKSIASVKEWFQRNLIASSSNNDDNAAVKDVESILMGAIETTLSEIHQSTGEKFTQVCLESVKKLNTLEEKVVTFTDTICRNIQETRRSLMDMACETLRADAESKVAMVRLLREDIQAALRYRPTS